MSEEKVDLVFAAVPGTNLWQLVGVASVFVDAIAIAKQRLSDGFSVAVRRIAVDEARELAMIPGAFGCSPLDELPGELRFGRHWTE